MEINVRTLTGAKSPITVQPSEKVSSLRQAIFETLGFAPDTQRLLYLGKELKSDDVIASCGIQAGDTITLLIRHSTLPTPKPREEKKSSSESEQPKLKPEIEKCWSLAYSEDWEKAKEVLESGNVSLDELETRTKKPLLLFFSERKMKKAVEYLIAKRGKPMLKAALEALNAAIVSDRMETANYFLDEIYSVKEFETLQGEPQPLHFAAAWGRVDLVRKLLEGGANANDFVSTPAEKIESNPVGTPLMAAACTSNFRDTVKTVVHCIDLLVDFGADINARSPTTGETALHMLCKVTFNSAEILLQLIKNGIDIYAKDNEGKTAMDLSAGSSLARPLAMAAKGKIKSRKRKAAGSSDASDDAEPPAKRVKMDETSQIFHTLPEDESRITEWAIVLHEDEEDDDSGEYRNDKGKSPVREAIQTDLLTLADSNSPLAHAAQVARSVAQALSGVILATDTDCNWIPFIVEVPVVKKKSSIMINIRQAIRAPKATLTQRKVGPKATFYFGQDEDEALPEGVKNALTLLRKETKELTEVSFPEAAICYPVFLGGTVEVNPEKYAIAGVFAIRVDT